MQKVQTYLLLSLGNSLILDFNPVSVRPILTHPESDTFLGFNKDIKIQSGFLEVDKPLQVIAGYRQNRKLHSILRHGSRAGSKLKQMACSNVRDMR